MAFKITPPDFNDPYKRGTRRPAYDPVVPPLKGSGEASDESNMPPPHPPAFRPPVRPTVPPPPPDPFAAKRARDQATGDAIRQKRFAQRDQNLDVLKRLQGGAGPAMQLPPTPPPVIDPRREMQRKAFERMQPPVM